MTVIEIPSPKQYFRSQASRPRKRFGQHFLTQPATAERIVDGAFLDPGDVVVEVGPGLGALTRFVASRVRRLHLVELDRDLARHLETLPFPSSCLLTVHQQDVLTFDFAGLEAPSSPSLIVLGNLPYNITSPLLFRLLDSASAIRRCVFMVQKEIGRRMTAQPGTGDYGVLSVLLAVHARTEALFTVKPGQFHPPPKVDSLVVRLEFRREPLLEGVPFPFLSRVVKTAFQQRRKTLANSLKPLAEPKLLEQALETSSIDGRRRPETLELEEFLRLGKALKAAGS